MRTLLTTAATAIAAALVLVAAPAAAQDFTITNVTVGKGDGSEPIENATVTVRGGTITSVSTGSTPASGANVIDGTGKWVTPGLVVALTDLGLYDVGAVSNSNDKGAGNARFAAAIDVATAINPASEHIKVSRAAGITRALVTPNNGPSIFAMLTRVDAEALVPVVSGRQMLYVEVEREADIRQVLRFKRAGNLVALNKVPGASGLSWGQALATITSLPAEIAGHKGKFGVIAPGATADIVIWDGDPLEVSTAPTSVYIDGVLQPMASHQTELAKRYLDLDESDLPKAYDW